MRDDIELNVWYKCECYERSEIRYVKFYSNIDNHDIIEGKWIYETKYWDDGTYKICDLHNLINIKELKPLEYEFINELFNSKDKDNIAIASIIINKI